MEVLAFAFGARWIALRWTPTFDGNRPVTTFNIYIQNVNETENSTFLIQLEPEALMRDGSSFRFNITNQSVVFPFIQYSFRVNTCNEIGCSEQSDPSDMIRTNEDSELTDLIINECKWTLFTDLYTHTHYVHTYIQSCKHTGPDAAPVITEAFSASSTTLYLSWDPPPPELHRGILTGYRITYYIENTEPAVQTTLDTSITLENLNAFTSYKVNISAETVVGYGPEGTINVMTLDDSKSNN